ncbi:putative ABC transport system permease protein [Prosthecobacter debontii]|uniref:Putative ABC transport system permease protein n=1 Tax=Prosthecobacter debontii TaxID=48467 RepID=A0A1T4WGU2_9BACT|nr:ABC transporter permease [Prosthecobacter debontii]SKA76554.1 putative ABC transport system permease protein [Prosthecobacter debontii]
MLWNAFTIALREIRRNLTRAFLTVLGIIIGVAAVITMVTLGQGTTQAVKNQISNLGTNLLTLRPGTGFGPRTAGVPNFTQRDADAVRDQITGLAAVAPVMSASLSTIYFQNARTTQITGTTPEYFNISKWSIGEGRFFTEEDYRTGAAVCVIGTTVQKELFEGDDALGKKIRLGKASCTVIGILVSKGQSFGGDQDDTVVVPLTTLQRRLVGKTSAQDVREIMMSAEDGADTDAVINDITSLMRQRRSLQANENDNFSIRDTRQLAETLSASTQMMTSLLAAVAGVSLLVGGIGIMNIMLVSVTERTREIGIRLAIGARAREVLLQFLVEAVTLSSIGGVIGISLALGLCIFLAQLIDVPFMFDARINIIAFFFSTAVGIIFGFTPARRAAKLDPIEALRHE